MEWTTILAFVLGFIIAKIGSQMAEHRSKPYRWACNDESCHFKVESSDAQLTLGMADDHQKSFHSKEN